jgi:A/G-specific adenine glycosylase
VRAFSLPTPPPPPRYSGSCSALNQSLMELGALVCTPRQPECLICPLAKRCVARRDGLTEALPNLGPRAPATARRFLACVLERDGKFLVRQRPVGIVNAHLWEFPNVEVPLKASAAQMRRLLESDLGGALGELVPLATVKHTITRYRITLEMVRGQMSGTLPRSMVGKWVSWNEARRLPFAGGFRKLLVSLEPTAATAILARPVRK